jgi:hypothetical protein
MLNRIGFSAGPETELSNGRSSFIAVPPVSHGYISFPENSRRNAYYSRTRDPRLRPVLPPVVEDECGSISAADCTHFYYINIST